MNMKQIDKSILHWFLVAALVAAVLYGVLAYHRTQSPTYPPTLIENAISVIKRDSYDPDNLKTESFTIRWNKSKQMFVACGNINGKNLFGAYTGFKPVAVAFYTTGEVHKAVYDVMELDQYCIDGELVK